MTIPSPLCLLRGLYGLRSYLSPRAWSRALRGGHAALAPVSGHVLRDVEVHASCTVIVSRCIDCGAQSLSWHHGSPRPGELAGQCSCHGELAACQSAAARSPRSG